MKLLTANAVNFASYGDLSFDFQNQGLTLVQGSTGSGKSTLLDLVPWVLYSRTAKNGLADDVLSWTSNDPTTASVALETATHALQVVRKRGSSASQNDLFFIVDNGDPIRGKDQNDTQKILNEYLGCDFDLYLAGSYGNEFSSTSTFFAAKAKERRILFEQLANLAFPKALAEKAQLRKKDLRPKIQELQSKTEKLIGKLDQLNVTLQDTMRRECTWNNDNKTKYQQLEKKHNEYEVTFQSKSKEWQETKDRKLTALQDRINEYSFALNVLERSTSQARITLEEIKTLEGRCKECGATKNHDIIADAQHSLGDLILKTRQMSDHLTHRHAEFADTAASQCPYQDGLSPYLNQLKDLETAENPYLEQVKVLTKTSREADQDLRETVKVCERLEKEYRDLIHIYDLTAQLRKEILTNVVSLVQDTTNSALQRHFHGELRVEFVPDAADKLEVTIQKNGYEASYSQLSKGQRGLLRLCFTVAVMEAAANQAGVHFSTLFFDEAMDGLDVDLKVAAYSLFQELSTKHATVLVVDHCTELKSLFSNQYTVTINQDSSMIEHNNG